MAHVSIFGITQSGKSTLAKALAQSYLDTGVGVLVCDPIGALDWPHSYQTTDAAAMKATALKSWQCALFVDESGSAIGRYQDELFWFATQARHWGHRSHFIAQRPAQIAKTVRDQCTRMILFAVSLSDAKALAEEWNKPELLTAPDLQQGEYFDVKRFGSVKRCRIF